MKGILGFYYYSSDNHVINVAIDIKFCPVMGWKPTCILEKTKQTVTAKVIQHLLISLLLLLTLLLLLKCYYNNY